MPIIRGLEGTTRTTTIIGGARSSVTLSGEPVIKRFVIGDVTNGCSIFGFETISQRQDRVVHVLCGDANAPQLQFSFFQIVILDVRPELINGQRKEFVRHLTRQLVFESRAEAARGVYCPMGTWDEQRREKRKTCRS